jgi:O-antigen/teichoic acid export membrane protein
MTPRSRLRALSRSELGRRLTVATVASGAIWGAGTLATFAIGVVLARRLGPEGYGAYGSAIAIVSLLSVPAQLGLPLLATREVSAAAVTGRSRDIAVLGWWFVGSVALASVLIASTLRLVAGALPFAPAIAGALATAAWLLPMLALSALGLGLLRGQDRVVISQLLDVLVRPLAFLAALLSWPRPVGPSQAIAAQIAAAAFITVAALALFFRGLPLTVAGGAERLRGWAAAALPMTLLEIMRMLEGNYAVLIAGHATSIADAGLLRVALASSTLVAIPIFLQSIVIAPFVTRAHTTGATRQLTGIIAASTLFMSVTVAAVLLALALLGRWALPFAFGPGFEGAYAPLMVLGGNQLLTALLGPNVLLLSMTGHEREVARAFIVSVTAAVAAGLLLTPLFGIAGTAASMLVATAIRGIMLNRHARRSLAVSPSLWGALMLASAPRPAAALRNDPS